MPMVNGKKYPYTTAGMKAAKAAAKKAKSPMRKATKAKTVKKRKY